MNTEAFEDLLDRITGTRNDTGRIKFLVDGDEYFGRLIETIESAEKSVDIRTYIFDNDDFAVSMACRLTLIHSPLIMSIRCRCISTWKADPMSKFAT
jgi:phosphatidylserine/phosphatidylglycerophosphate/cardiolipin synthase-like enzyme